ncbi:Putative methylase [Klebsiella pneumoniae]|nr:Putative methylase [Klebsiella pneumoniae]
MYRVLKKDALMVSFYGWNRVDRFMAAWKNAGFSVVGHLVFTKNYTSKAAYVGYRHECAYILAKGRPALPQKPLPDVLGWKYSGNRHHPTEKPVTSLQPLIGELHTPERDCAGPVCRQRLNLRGRPSVRDAGISVSSCLNSITVPDSNDWPPCNGPCSRGPRMITGLNRRLRK